MSESALTELESCVLGAIWAQGPCSAYAVRREFAASPSSHWSASTGSIYPTIRRLEHAGLVAPVDGPSDGRGTRDLKITRAGKARLRAWIVELPDWSHRPTRDAIRTRVNFLSALPDRHARLDFIQRAERGARDQIGVLRKRLVSAQAKSEDEAFVTLGSLHELLGRARWLRDVRRRLETQSA